MKAEQIQVDKSYSDGKGNVRKVIAEGNQYLSYSGQTDSDCVRYRVEVRTKGPLKVGSERNCTRATFAAWAKEEA